MTSPSPMLSWTRLLQRTPASPLHNASAREQKLVNIQKCAQVAEFKWGAISLPFVFCKRQSVWAVSWCSGWAPLFAFVTFCFQRADFLYSDVPYLTRPCHKMIKIQVTHKSTAKLQSRILSTFRPIWLLWRSGSMHCTKHIFVGH